MTPNPNKIVIENPCSQSWDAMEADTIGRFCQSCQKSVIDFSSKSDTEIKTFLKDKQGENICGRFYIHQVDRIRIELDQDILISNIPFWQKFLVVLLVCFGSDFLGVDFAFSQTNPDSIPFKTEQIDSVVSLAIPETDSILEAHTDSVCIPKTPPKPDEPNWVILNWRGDDFTMGAIYNPGYDFNQSIPDLSPELKIDFVNRKPVEEIPSDILVKDSKHEIPPSASDLILTLKNNPVIPKHPKRKSLPQENAVIADSGVKRKTRRS